MIIKGIEASDPARYQPVFNLKRILFITVGKIPRGKIKAPLIVQPTVMYNRETLAQHLSETRANLQRLDGLDRAKFFTHPFLGDFKLLPAKRFLQIHTNHHAAIINDIVASTADHKNQNIT